MRALAPLLLLLLCGGCRLLVDVPIEEEPEPAAPDVEPLGAAELLRFTWENLGEISPGLAYRSAKVNGSLLDFLQERCRLGHILNLRGQPNPIEIELVDAGTLSMRHVPMSVRRPPSPREIIEMIRITHEARESGRSLLIHCRAGADRTGVMVAIWRMLFQGVTDRNALKWETWLYGHWSLFHEMVHRTIDRFRPELFRPFIEDPSLLENEELIAEVEGRYHEGYPVVSGDKRTEQGELRAGAGKSDLLGDLPLPVQMATYGPNPGKAEGVREPVYARAIVVETGTKRLALVSADLMIIDARLRDRVLRALDERGAEVDDLLLAATHTHTSIGGYVEHRPSEFYIMGRYDAPLGDHLVAKIVEAVELAVADLGPALLGAGRAFVHGLTENRRIGDTVDPEVGVVRMTRPGGEPLATIVNYTGHPILEPDDGQLSGDYPAILARQLDETAGFGFFLQGALGDVNARPPGEGPAWIAEGLAEKVALRLHEAVMETLDEIELHPEVELASMTIAVDLPPLNISLIPDLLYPLDRAIGRLVDWPPTARVQVVKLGPAALVAFSSEIGVRLGLQAKRCSLSDYPFVVTHANGYSGYAVTQVNYAKSKLDPTSIPALNGPTHGRHVVDEACEMFQTLWGRAIERTQRALSPAAQQRFEERSAEIPESAHQALWLRMIREEEEAALARADPTIGQTRRRDPPLADSIPDCLRLGVRGAYIEDMRGGRGLEGRRREARFAARLLGPRDLRLGATAAYRRSDWSLPGGGEGSDEGITDVLVQLERPFALAASSAKGTALRLIPVAALEAPTGNADGDAPLAFALSSGTWRPGAGGALELTWDTYRVLSLRGRWFGAIGRHDGRQPGDRFEASLGYVERHGMVSFLLDLAAEVELPDDRRGGRRVVDVQETSFDLGLRPGILWHGAESLDVYVEGRVPLARGGSAGGGGVGILGGIRLAW